MKICVIVPIYNEDRFLDSFLSSIVNQTVVPDILICVDDNSTDSSSLIIKKYEEKYSFIKYVFHDSESKKIQGKKVIQAFNYGLQFIRLDDYSIISKIDADLELPPDYFNQISILFDKDYSIGIAGGRIIEFHNGNWNQTIQASYHIRGALKSYRTECFKDIDGLKPVLGWDGLDEMSAFYLGWKTQIVDLEVKHFRPAASDYNYKDLCFKIGFANYCNGSNLFLALIRAFVRSIRKFNALIFYYFVKGYLTAKFTNHPKNVSPDLARFINRFHFRRIVFKN